MRDMSNHIANTMYRVNSYYDTMRCLELIDPERRHAEAYLHIVVLTTHRFRADCNIVNITT
jgi:hypothetical protein